MTPEEQLEEQRRQQALKEAQQRNDALAVSQKQDQIDALDVEATELQAALDESGPALEAELAQPQREEGIVSQVGNFVSDLITGDVYHNISSSLFPDTFKSADELKQEQAQRVGARSREDASLYDRGAAEVERNLEAVSSGMLAAPMLPFSFAAGLTGQKQEWNEAPQIVKDTFASKAVYDVTKVAFPSLFVAPVVGGATALAGLATGTRVAVSAGSILATESLVETVANQDPDDYILSRTASKSVGDLVNMMGGNGTEVTRRLLEGEGIEYRAAGMVAGFFLTLH